MVTLDAGDPCRLASLPPGLPAGWPPCRLASLPPDLPAAWLPCRLRKTDVFARTVGKTDVFARTVSKTDVFGLLAPKTASRPPRRLWTGLLAPNRPSTPELTIRLTRHLSDWLQMNLAACRLASSHYATPWCPRRPLEGSPGAKQAFDACACLSVRRCLHDNSLDETSVR